MLNPVQLGQEFQQLQQDFWRLQPDFQQQMQPQVRQRVEQTFQMLQQNFQQLNQQLQPLQQPQLQQFQQELQWLQRELWAFQQWQQQQQGQQFQPQFQQQQGQQFQPQQQQQFQQGQPQFQPQFQQQQFPQQQPMMQQAQAAAQGGAVMPPPPPPTPADRLKALKDKVEVQDKALAKLEEQASTLAEQIRQLPKKLFQPNGLGGGDQLKDQLRAIRSSIDASKQDQITFKQRLDDPLQHVDPQLQNLENDALSKDASLQQIQSRADKQADEQAKTVLANPLVEEVQRVDTIKDEFLKNRFIPDEKGTPHDSYNFWSPVGNIFKKPFDNVVNSVSGFTEKHRLLAFGSLGLIPLAIGIYETLRSIPGMIKDAFKAVGNLLNVTCNAVGAGLNSICKFIAGSLDAIANSIDGVINKMVNVKDPTINGILRPFAGLLKCVSAPLHVAAKGVDMAGVALQDGCGAIGAVCRVASNPLAASSWKAMWSCTTQCVANAAMAPLAMVKETGTQFKELGNTVDFPIISHACRGVGNIVLATSVVGEGIVQGTKQFLHAKNGFQAVADGVETAYTTLAVGTKEFVGNFTGAEKAPAVTQRKSGISGQVFEVEQKHAVAPRNTSQGAYQDLVSETVGALKGATLKETMQKKESEQKAAAAARRAEREQSSRGRWG